MQSTGRGHQNVWLALQQCERVLFRHPALETLTPDVETLTKAVELPFDLLGQLACIAEYDARERFGVCHAVEHDEDEDRRLARA